MPIAINTLEYARLLIDSGVEQKQAEAHALTLDKTLKEHVPSKEDVQSTIEQAQTQLKRKIQTDIDSSIDTAKIEINSTIEKVKSELKQDISELKSELKQDISELKSDNKLMKWMLGFQFAMILAIFVKLFVG